MAINEHLVLVNLKINGKIYPLKAKISKEGYYRDAASNIERKISQYRNYFSGADIRKLDEADYAIMTTIQAVAERNELDAENKYFEDKIKALTQELDLYLKK